MGKSALCMLEMASTLQETLVSGVAWGVQSTAFCRELHHIVQGDPPFPVGAMQGMEVLSTFC